MKKKVKKYNNGYFVEPPKFDLGGFAYKNVDTINQGSQFAASAVNMAEPVNGDTNAGLSAVSGGLSGLGEGAKIGSMFGPEGTIIGAGVGLVGGAAYGLFTGNKKHEAYQRQQLQIKSNQAFTTKGNMQQANIDPYGNQMALGDLVEGPGDPVKGGIKTPTISRGTIGFPGPNDPYWKLHPLWTEHTDGTYRQWGEKPNSLDLRTLTQKLGNNVLIEPQSSVIPTPIINGTGDGANPAMVQQRKGPVVQSVPSTSGYYAEGDYVNTQDDPQFQAQNATSPMQGQPTMINIEKGELRINADKGKILQEYKGINPLTGGLYESHAKNGKQESSNNITQANTGDFVVTKKTAKAYKDAVDNNDKLSKDTILMNIRNNKIEKEGGLKSKGKFALGDQVGDDPTQSIMNYEQWNAFLGNPGLNAKGNPNSNSLPTTLPGLQKDGNAPQYKQVDLPAYSKPQSGISQLGDTISKYGPSMFNIGQGLFGKVNTIPQGTPVTNPYLANIQANMPKNINMNPLVEEQYRQSNLAAKDIQNNTNSTSVYRANRQNIASNLQRGIANTRMQMGEANNNIARERSGIYQNLGEQSIRDQEQLRNYNLDVNQINNRALAAKQNYLNTGLSQMQQVYQNDKQNSQKQNMDMYTLQLLKQMYPSMNPYNLYDPEYLKKVRAGQLQ